MAMCSFKEIKRYNVGVVELKECKESKLGVSPDGDLVKIRVLKDNNIKVYYSDHTEINNSICPVEIWVNGHEMKFTSYPYLIKDGVSEGDQIYYGTRNGYAYIRKKKNNSMFVNGYFNLNLPKGYITLLGYYDT